MDSFEVEGGRGGKRTNTTEMQYKYSTNTIQTQHNYRDAFEVEGGKGGEQTSVVV